MKKIFKSNKFTAEFEDERGYFSLTGYTGGACGAVGDDIAEIDKKFSLINKLHLSDCKTGEPMHAEANGMYHAGRMDKKSVMRTLRCTEGQASELVDLAFRINGSQKRIDEIQPYRKHFCSLPVNEFHKQQNICTRDQLEKQDRQYKKCSHEYVAMVELSDITTNLSGEKTQWCPKCGKKPQYSTDWIHKNGKPYNHNVSSDLGEELQNLYNIHYTAKKKVQEFFNDLRNQWAVEAREVYKAVESIPSDLRTKEDNFDITDFDEPERVLALAEFLDCDTSIITEGYNGNYVFSAQGSDWMVVTDSEADDIWENDLENYVEECILYEMEPHLRDYFDKEQWIEDAKDEGERANSLARYDGVEHFISTDDGDFYIYQQ